MTDALVKLRVIKYDSKLDRVILITGRELASEEQKQIAGHKYRNWKFL